MFTPPFRAVLLKSIGLAILLLIMLGIGLHRLFAWLATEGGGYLEGVTGPGLQTPLHALLWVLAIAAGFGLLAGTVFIMPAVTAFVASFFSDEIAAEVERVHYPADPPGQPISLTRATLEGVKTALLALLVYLIAVPFLLFAGFGFLIFFVANAWLLGREYFLLAAMRFHSVTEAKVLRRQNASTVFTAGCLIAAFVSIPILNLATPLFGMAFMVHMHKRLSAPRPELIAFTQLPLVALYPNTSVKPSPLRSASWIASPAGPVPVTAPWPAIVSVKFAETSKRIASIGIELYGPLPGGVAVGGRFAPETIKVRGLREIEIR